MGQILDLFLLFIRRIGFNLLLFYRFIVKKVVVLLIIGLIGMILGFLWNFAIIARYQRDVIVQPNVESEGYLRDKISEIESNLKTKDSIYFAELGINIEDLEIKNIRIEDIGERLKKADLEDEKNFLEMLESFKDDAYIIDLVKAEISRSSSLNRRIVFELKSPSRIAEEQTEIILDYINKNVYYSELVEALNINAERRIKTNDNLVTQIDNLILNYTEQLLNTQSLESGQIVLGQQEEKIDVKGLLTLKNEILANTEMKNIELERRKEPISIISLGKIKKRELRLFSNAYFILPLFFYLIFFIIHGIKIMNRKITVLDQQVTNA